jgi:hypothetical protein
MCHNRVACLPLMALVVGMEHQDRKCPLKHPEVLVRIQNLQFSIILERVLEDSVYRMKVKRVFHLKNCSLD